MSDFNLGLIIGGAVGVLASAIGVIIGHFLSRRP